MAKADEVRRLEETRMLAGLLADRMMAAYVVGGRPTEAEVRALCGAVLLLEDRAIPLPAFAEDVIRRLTAEEEAAESAPPRLPGTVLRPRPLATLGRALRTLRPRLAA